jgi:O-antigen biosynthesis protein WbqP
LVRHTPYTAFFKPLLDKAAALLLFLLLSPLLAVLALLVKLTSKGPALFRQKRIGRGKREFMILKFRTMYMTAPSDMPTHMLANAGSHITGIGRFLRKSSLDELPQLMNILSGEMSFVGPRPALWNQFDLIAERDKYWANDATPGVTGWAQVTGRDELPIPEKAAKDGFYAANISLMLDVRIVFKTFISVLAAKGVVEGAAGDDRK